MGKAFDIQPTPYGLDTPSEADSGWTAVIVNYNGAPFLDSCILALQRCTLPPAEIIVVDNASQDDSLLELHGFPEVHTIAEHQNHGFAGGANIGLAETETGYALILNPDVQVDPNFGAALVHAFAGNPRLGAAGALLLYPDEETVQHAGGILERPVMTTRHAGYRSRLTELELQEQDVDFVTGAALGLRLAAVREVGGFDEALTPVYYEDVDLCVRLRSAGWQVRFNPYLRAIHHEGVTLGRSESYYRHFHRNRLRFALKHLSGDEWRAEFVPAEIARLRGDFQALEDAAWPEISGAAAVDRLLREGDANEALWEMESLLSPSSLTALPAAVRDARERAAVPTAPLQSRIPLVGRLRNAINDLGPRWYIDTALAEQRRFNESVVEALEAQDRVNREQTATTLLFALLALERVKNAVRLVE